MNRRCNPRFFPLLLTLTLLLLVGCAGLGGRQGESTVDPSDETGRTEQQPSLPFPQPQPTVGELNSDMVYNSLAGEVALQRGELDLAYRHLLRTANLTADAVAAERAARVAMLMKRDELALVAVEKWVAVQPNSLEARQLAVLLLQRRGGSARALVHMDAILAISEARGEDGFLANMAALSKSEDRPAALSLLRQLAGAHPSDRRGGYALALLAMIWKDAETAQREIDGVIQRWPDWSKAYVLRSRIQMAIGNQDAARSGLEAALKKYPDDVALNSALAKVLVEASAYKEAFDRFQKVVRLAPDDSDARFSLGILALQLKRPDAARTQFELLQSRGVRLNETAYYLGLIEEQAGQTEPAIAWYRKVAKGEHQVQAGIRVAQLMAENGRLSEARDVLRALRIQKAKNSVQLFLIEAELVRDHGQAAQVLPVYDKALRAHPENDDILYARGLYAAEVGRLDILEADMRSILERNPKHADALNALGYTLADQSDRYAEAEHLIARALELKPDSPAILDSMGWLHFRLGKHQQALSFLSRAFELLPDPEIAAHLGEVLWVTGQRQRAQEVWDKILDIDPESRHVKKTMQRLMQP